LIFYAQVGAGAWEKQAGHYSLKAGMERHYIYITRASLALALSRSSQE